MLEMTCIILVAMFMGYRKMKLKIGPIEINLEK